MDYYDILEIPYNSSEELIKSSYKKLARKNHPDAGGDVSKFYEISQAYQTLIDPIARQDYDHSIGIKKDWANAEEIYFHSVPNADITVSHTLELRETFTGKKVDITYPMKNGSFHKVTLRIPPGVQHNDTLRVAGAGENYIRGNPRGDLLVNIKVKPEKNFKRDGDNLITSYAINALDLITGCAIVCRIPHYERVELDIPAGTQPGTVFSLPGYGFPNINSGKTGSLYVKILASIPMITDKESLEKLHWIKQHAQEDNSRGSKQRTTPSI